MKVSVIALQLVGAAFVLASSKDCTSVALNAIPSCAQPCYLENAGKIGCDGLDFACQCKQKTAMFEAIQGCVAIKCPEAMFEKVIDGSNEVCDCAAPGATQPIPSPKPTPTTTLKTVHNTVASSIPVSSIPVSSIPVSSIQSAIAAPTNAGEGDWDYPSRPSPTYFAKASGAERSSAALGLSALLSAVLAFMAL